MTQTVPDISPLMPMRQDPLLVFFCFNHFLYPSQGRKMRFGFEPPELLLVLTDINGHSPNDRSDDVNIHCNDVIMSSMAFQIKSPAS